MKSNRRKECRKIIVSDCKANFFDKLETLKHPIASKVSLEKIVDPATVSKIYP